MVSEIGSVWSRAKKLAKQAKSGLSSARRIGKRAGRYASKVSKYASSASSLLPGAAAAMTAVKLLRAARKGNKSARRRLDKMENSAQAGDPNAQKAVAVVKAVSDVPQAQASFQPGEEEKKVEQAAKQVQEEQEGVEPEDEEEFEEDEEAEYDEPVSDSVSGWLLNRGYRNNVQAGELDRKNPGHAMRALYVKGLGRGKPTVTDALALGKKLLGL